MKQNLKFEKFYWVYFFRYRILESKVGKINLSRNTNLKDDFDLQFDTDFRYVINFVIYQIFYKLFEFEKFQNNPSNTKK